MWFVVSLCTVQVVCKYRVCRSRPRLGLTGDGAQSSFSRYSDPSLLWPALSLSLRQTTEKSPVILPVLANKHRRGPNLCNLSIFITNCSDHTLILFHIFTQQ